jgi:5-methylcytosine-specific restriction endonuclease McrA
MITLQIYCKEHIFNITKLDYCNYKIKLSSRRIKLFSKQDFCQCCNLESKFFELNCFSTEKPHLNLYGVNEYNQKVLFTLDHIIPLSKNGHDVETNYQTLCERCNVLKNDSILSIEELKERLELYNYLKFCGATHKEILKVL